MLEARNSPVVSQLFTQCRDRNASVILMQQNMFPKGKYNTDISRNAQYLALFRSPSDRKQIGIIGERMFDKNEGLPGGGGTCSRVPLKIFPLFPCSLPKK